MRYLLLVQATGFTETGMNPGEDYKEAVKAYRQSLAEAGVLLAAEELRPSAAGMRIAYLPGRAAPEVWPGPFPIEQGLIAEFALIDVDTEEEALNWALRMPVPSGQGICGIELRRLEDKTEHSHHSRQTATEAGLKDFLQL